MSTTMTSPLRLLAFAVIVVKGSLQNLADILYLRGIDVGIVQSDALAYAKQRNLYPSLDNVAKELNPLLRGGSGTTGDTIPQRWRPCSDTST
jgi:hypothetical protein